MHIIIYDRVLTEHRRLEAEIKDLQKLIKSFPDGGFYVSRNQSRYKWFHTDGKNKTYIPKRKRKFAEKLASKKYLTLLLKDLTKEKTALEFYLRHHSQQSEAHKLLSDNPEYQKLLAPYFTSVSQELQDWVQSSYEKNTNHPEQLIQKTLSGNYVRSKSESLIDTLLFVNKIPFRYECKLELGDTTIYPDFTIRHPETGKIYYWEHFGRMDDPNYCKNVFSKLQLYANYGIIPTIQLITTYETRLNPLSSETIEKIIKNTFCD